MTEAERLAQLIARSFERKPSKICWRQNLEGFPDQYMTEIDKLSYPAEVTGVAVFRILTQDLGLPTTDISLEKVRSHLRGDCKCPNRKSKI